MRQELDRRVEVRLRYQENLALALIDSQPGWEITEKAKHHRLLDYTTGTYRTCEEKLKPCRCSSRVRMSLIQFNSNNLIEFQFLRAVQKLMAVPFH